MNTYSEKIVICLKVKKEPFFLENVHAMDLEVQDKFLKFLIERTIENDSYSCSSGVRLIFATTEDLKMLVGLGGSFLKNCIIKFQ